MYVKMRHFPHPPPLPLFYCTEINIDALYCIVRLQKNKGIGAGHVHGSGDRSDVRAHGVSWQDHRALHAKPAQHGRGERKNSRTAQSVQWPLLVLALLLVCYCVLLIVEPCAMIWWN